MTRKDACWVLLFIAEFGILFAPLLYRVASNLWFPYPEANQGWIAIMFAIEGFFH
jgi:hypothetical protein